MVVADAGMLSAANLLAVEGAGLSFIVGSRVSNAPYDLADQLANRGNFFADGQIIKTTRQMGVGSKARDRRVVWQYSAARERRDNRTLNLQIDRAQQVADGKRPIKKDRFVKFTGDKPGIDTARIDQARIVIGLKGYVTNIPETTLDGRRSLRPTTTCSRSRSRSGWPRPTSAQGQSSTTSATPSRRTSRSCSPPSPSAATSRSEPVSPSVASSASSPLRDVTINALGHDLTAATPPGLAATAILEALRTTRTTH